MIAISEDVVFPTSEAPQDDCECPLDHSVTKLGHCKDCPYKDVARPVLPDVPLAPGGPPRHADGTPHDYEWATYADDHQSYGVCRCGHDSMSASLWEEF